MISIKNSANSLAKGLANVIVVLGEVVLISLLSVRKVSSVFEETNNC